MKPIPFLIGTPGAAGRLNENLFFEPEMEDGRPALRGTPGLTLWLALGGSSGTRKAWVFDEYLYTVTGNTVYRIDTTPTATALATTLDTSSGNVWMSDNGINMMIVDGTSGYIVTGTTLTKITDADFPVPSSLTFQDGYYIVTESGTGRIYISDSYGGTDWDALDYSTAEGNPDDVLVAISDHREVWLPGVLTTEVFYNSQDPDFPFERITGSFIEAGIGAVASIVKADNTLFWLSDKAQVIRASGYTPVYISTPRIEKEIAGYSTWSDAIGFSYTHDGHIFYCLTFPTADKTLVYDITVSQKLGFPAWHRRTSQITGLYTHGRHRANCYAKFDNKHIVGDFENGNLYYFDASNYTDNDNIIRAVHYAPSISKDGHMIFHHRLESEFKMGVGIVTGQGSEPKAMLDWSDDGGRTWSNEHWRSMGKIGEYDARAIWRRLGKSRSREYRQTITDPVERVLYGGTLQAEIGAH